ncbi:MAG: hypothetical protein ACXWJK_16550 [Burkholderiaceae bacterium]
MLLTIFSDDAKHMIDELQISSLFLMRYMGPMKKSEFAERRWLNLVIPIISD